MPAHQLRPRSWGWFAAWVAVGSLYPWVVLGALSIGPFVLPVAAVATVLLARRSEARCGIPGVAVGCGLPLLFVAWTNRSGPGVVCTTKTTAVSWQESCGEQWSPWPWLIAAVVLGGIGVAGFVRQRSTT